MGVPRNQITLPYTDKFFTTIDETSNPDNSNDPVWNLTSGGYLDKNKGVLRNNQIDLQPGHKWYEAYKNNVDAEGGAHPENITRFVTRQGDFLNVTVSANFRITRVSFSDSPNRTPDKGLSIFLHYKSENDLYVAGIRHDGQAFIKRKATGVYTTLAIQPWFPGHYDRETNPTLLPVGTPFSLKFQSQFVYNKTKLTLWITEPGTTRWITALSVEDDFPALAVPGRIGFRMDFTSCEIDDVTIS